MSQPPAETLRADIGAMLHAALGVSGVETIEPLAAGPGADTFVVTAAARRFVAKQVAKTSPRSLSLEREFELLGSLVAERLTAAPVAMDAARGLLITEFVEDARPMMIEEIREPAGMRSICQALRRLHRSAPELPPFDPERIAIGYLDRLDGDWSEPAERGWADEFLALARAYSETFPPVTICHNDLVAENILSGSSTRLIDFEYAASASPVLDLASLAEMNELDETEAAGLVEIYHQDLPPPFSAADFATVRRLVRLIAHFWARGQHGRYSVDLARYLGPDKN
jgi:thiamine kinase-like enzyme